MKPRYFLLSVAFLLLASCASREQKVSEGILIESLKAPSTYKFISFEPESVMTLGEELNGRIKVFENNVDFDKRLLEMYSGFLEDAREDLKDAEQERKRYGKQWDSIVDQCREMVTDYEEKIKEQEAELNKDQRILDALNALLETSDQSKETGKIYALTYEAQNTFGVPLKGVLHTHFKENGELVEYRSDDESWVVVGDVFSIPGYYDLIGINKN